MKRQSDGMLDDAAAGMWCRLLTWLGPKAWNFMCVNLAKLSLMPSNSVMNRDLHSWVVLCYQYCRHDQRDHAKQHSRHRLDHGRLLAKSPTCLDFRRCARGNRRFALSLSFLKDVALPVDWYVELGSTTWAFKWLEVTLRWQCCEQLLLAGEVADWARKRVVRSKSVPPVDEPLNVDRLGAVRFEVVKKHVEQSGALY
ncbi:hypothetical protein OKW43_008117 [Paraburkholderia sp. WC7.3g]|uniref:hypothetical protein n=1 Tax=Paraburkholderia sp. WC7.3g TaxID=2991070 RepID=UPI003D22BD7E